MIKAAVVLVLLMAITAGCSKNNREPISATGNYSSPIKIGYPEGSPELGIISRMPGMLRLAADDGEDFVNGVIEVDKEEWFPTTRVEGARVSLIQEAKKIGNNEEPDNTWKLKASDRRPFILKIENGEAEGHWNLSGMPITELYANLGAAKNAFTFDEVNPQIMERCEIKCGAGETIIEGILNAACESMTIAAGGGDLTMRFRGMTTIANPQTKILPGDGKITLSTPESIPLRFTVAGRNQVIPNGNIIIVPGESGTMVYETPSCGITGAKAIEVEIGSGDANIYLDSTAAQS